MQNLLLFYFKRNIHIHTFIQFSQESQAHHGSQYLRIFSLQLIEINSLTNFNILKKSKNGLQLYHKNIQH